MEGGVGEIEGCTISNIYEEQRGDENHTAYQGGYPMVTVKRLVVVGPQRRTSHQTNSGCRPTTEYGFQSNNQYFDKTVTAQEHPALQSKPAAPAEDISSTDGAETL